MPEHAIALFGGIYNNYLALEAALADAKARGVARFYCLGDMGAFGPYPDRVFPLLCDNDVQCIQGNYDHSIGNGLADCRCGYTDPRDNHFAHISYAYTFQHTSIQNRDWLRQLPPMLRFDLGTYRVLLCHGSPRKTNEFLWESTCANGFLEYLLRENAVDVIAATHTGIKWHRELPGDKHFVNVGVLGRPENDGTPRVWYTLLTAKPQLEVAFVPVVYDHERLAREMESERLPPEFVQTIRTGWWTTCLEIMPAKERGRGRH